MPEQIGKIQKPLVEKYREKRKIFLLPLFYRGQGAPDDYVRVCENYWKEAGEHLEMLNRAIATYRKIKPTLGGNRYVLCEPPVLVAPEHREHGQWEVYEYLSVDERTISVFFFRCMSSETEHRAVLKGLDEKAGYRMASHSGRLTDVFSGAELMESGIVCQLPRQLSADIVMLSRV